MRSATVASWINLFVQMAGTIVIIPLIWNRWGDMELGVFLLISSVTRFSLLFSDRLAMSFATSFAFVAAGSRSIRPVTAVSVATDTHQAHNAADQPHQRSSTELYSALFETLGSILFGVSIVMGTLASSISLPSMFYLCSGFGGANTDCIAAMSLSLLTTVLRINLVRYEIFLRGLDKVATLARWNALFNCVGLAAIIVCVYWGGTILHWALLMNGTILLAGIRNIFLAWAQRSQFDVREAQLFGWDTEVIEAIWSPTWRGLINSISYIGGDEMVVLLTPFFLSGQETTQFLLYNRCFSVVGPIAQIPLTARLPYISRLVSSGNIERLKAFMLTRFLFCGLLVLIGGNLVAIGVPILAALSGREITQIPLAVWSLIVFLYIIERLNVFFNAVLESGNRITLVRRRLFVTLASLVLLPILIKGFGMIGGFLSVLLPRTLMIHRLVVNDLVKFSSTSFKDIASMTYFPLLGIQLMICGGLWLCAISGYDLDVSSAVNRVFEIVLLFMRGD